MALEREHPRDFGLRISYTVIFTYQSPLSREGKKRRAVDHIETDLIHQFSTTIAKPTPQAQPRNPPRQRNTPRGLGFDSS